MGIWAASVLRTVNFPPRDGAIRGWPELRQFGAHPSPIEFDVRRNGFFFTGPVRHVPQVQMSQREMFALFIASKANEQYRGTPFHAMLEATFKKLSWQLDDSMKFSVGNLEQVLYLRPDAQRMPR
jgi:hypothetical protein